jgi:hypothetical protein
VADDAVGQNILGVANAGAIVADGRGGNTQRLAVAQGTDAGFVQTHTGVIQDDGTHLGTGNQIAGVGTGVGATHQHAPTGRHRDLGRRGCEHEARA